MEHTVLQSSTILFSWWCQIMVFRIYLYHPKNTILVANVTGKSQNPMAYPLAYSFMASWLVVDLPLSKMMDESSVGMMKFPIEWKKNQAMFQTTNQHRISQMGYTGIPNKSRKNQADGLFHGVSDHLASLHIPRKWCSEQLCSLAMFCNQKSMCIWLVVQ